MNVSIWLTVFGVRVWKSWKTSGPLKSLAALVGSVYWTLIVQNGPCGMLALMSALPDVRVMLKVWTSVVPLPSSGRV